MRSSRCYRGFTLIELLVVIAIIAILASILFPVFARARENARKTNCLSNLKQMGLAMMQYTQDYDERYPMWMWIPKVAQTEAGMPGRRFNGSCGNSSCSGYNITWKDLIHPYLKSTQIFVCPSTSFSTEFASYGYSTAFGGWNMYARWNRNWAYGDIPIPMATVQRPSEVFMILEYNDLYNLAPYPVVAGQKARSTDVDENKMVAPHLEGGNVVFADGHAKWISRGRIGEAGNLNTWCFPNSPNYSIGYCSRDWNPFIP